MSQDPIAKLFPASSSLHDLDPPNHNECTHCGLTTREAVEAAVIPPCIDQDAASIAVGYGLRFLTDADAS